MEENLRSLSNHLSEASSIISSLLNPNTSTSSSTVSTDSVNTTVNRARAMLNSSISRGNFTRLNRRERLRAAAPVAPNQSTQPSSASKKRKENEEKIFEFVLVDTSKYDENEWTISNDIVALRGLIEVATSSKESDIRKEIGNAVRLKFPAVNDSDFEFLRATRRKLSKPVNCKGSDFKQLKLIAGQGAVYVKVKDEMACLLVELEDMEEKSEDKKKDEDDENKEEANDTKLNDDKDLMSSPFEVKDIEETEATMEGPEEICDLVKLTAEYCQEHEIANPVEILRYYQKVMVVGRPLNVEDPSQTSEGATNFIMVDRHNLIQSAFDEIKELTNLRQTLEVQFYGEEAEDYGGPRREFFRLIIREIFTKYFEHGLKPHMAEDYLLVGIVFGLSIVQGGKIPTFSEDIINYVFSPSVKDACLEQLQMGFKKVGIYQLAMKMRLFRHLFRAKPSRPLTVKEINHLLKPEFSDEGSNSRKNESTVYGVFQKYLREVASGRRAGIDLGHILQFATGTDEEPILGFCIHPSMSFYEVSESFLPTANTCVNSLKIPRPTHSKPLPNTDVLFELYDLAFKNAYFGSK